MSKLSKIDSAAASKGSGIETLWQFVKFIVVSLAAFVIQACLPMLIELFMSDDFLHREFTFWIFKSTSETVVKDGVESVVVSGLGIFLASTFSNILAQIVSFFINKDKTFNSSKKTSTTLPIYIVFTIALICFSAWLTPTFTGFLMTKGLGVEAASGISGALCGMIQFFLYFPVDKILFSEKKEKKAKK